MSTERYNHRADIKVQLHNGLQLAGHESTENMYSSIDLVFAKIERQVRKYKDKLKTHKVRGNFEPIPWTHTIFAEKELPESGRGSGEQIQVVEKEKEVLPEPVVVSKSDQYHAEPLTVSQAAMQLNLLHKQFFVFRNAESGEVNVVYRRGDGSFGLIEASQPT